MRQPKHPFHPGVMLLEEFLRPAAEALGTSSRLWMNLQATT